ncbi:MAG: murein biosynthesis integral membrane protein MurJ [Alphaproteobacteria bacterium CG1_02_46_17]|nr:MAG: murein biosynthesis integral membrane protein MurJ [Alphaproteobacteria bacterium CG1_02_46_17]
MKLLKAMATIAGFTLLSRVAGMIRDMLTASVLGAGPIADAFFVALKLPNLFRRIAAEGAFSVSFIPLYSKTLAQEGDDAAGKFSGQVFSVMLLILSVFSALIMLVMPWVIHVIAPGFYEGSERYEAAVTLTQLTFPYLLLMSLVALFGGMLNAHSKFGPFSAAPIIFNLTLIAFMLAGTPFFPTAGHAMAVGVSVSGLVQLAMMAFFIRHYKITFHFQRPKLGEKTKHMFKLMGPGVLSAGVFQINLFVDMMVASLLPAGAISFLYYADRLNQLPLSLAGIAVGTALLPMLSRALAEKNHEESKDLFNRALEFCFFVAIPSAVALLIIPIPMVATLFEHGKFTAHETLQTSYVLMGYAIGLPAYIASKVFMTAFWSHGDTVTPVKISILSALSNVALCLLLIGLLGVAGISLATGIVGWMQVYLLHKQLKGKDALDFDKRLRTVFPKVVVCSCIMAMVLAGLNYGLQDYFHRELHVKILALLALIGGGAITYALAVQVSGILKISDIKNYLKRRKG